LSFEEKYVNNAKSSMSPKREFPYETPHNEAIWQAAEKICRSLNCKGVLQPDCLIDNATQAAYISEINSIPGSISLYMWKNKYTFTELVDKLIESAIKLNTKPTPSTLFSIHPC